MRGFADLHIHSSNSDGVYPPRELAAMAKASGITVLALTDHDTLKGLPEMKEAAASAGIDFIPGVEFSARWENRQVHILGYGIDEHNALLLERLADVRDARRSRLEKIIKRLHEMGMDVDVPVPEEGQRAVGRPHIARALVAQRYVRTVQEAFDLYIGEGRPAYQPQTKMTPPEAVELIHQAGGLAVQAHPEEIGDREMALRLLEELPYDGSVLAADCTGARSFDCRRQRLSWKCGPLSGKTDGMAGSQGRCTGFNKQIWFLISGSGDL